MLRKNSVNENHRKVKKKNVYRAIELLRSKTSKEESRKVAEDEKLRNINFHCAHIPGRNKRKVHMTPFSKSLIISEIRQYLSRHEWKHVRMLFPSLLDCPIELEPIVWRYAMIILLYSPSSDISNLCEFLEMCTGSQTEHLDQILRNLLLLKRITP